VVPCTMVAICAAESATRATPFMKPRASSPRVLGTLTMRALPSRSSRSLSDLNPLESAKSIGRVF